MFGNTGITNINGNFPKLQKADGMFYGCPGLIEFEGNLQNLTKVYAMFCWCNYLKTFKANLDLLKDGSNMFAYCQGLKSFDAELISLTWGWRNVYQLQTRQSFCSKDYQLSPNNERSYNICNLGPRHRQNSRDRLRTIGIPPDFGRSRTKYNDRSTRSHS
jgi:hypothetical protein